MKNLCLILIVRVLILFLILGPMPMTLIGAQSNSPATALPVPSSNPNQGHPLVFVLDLSGSMKGPRLHALKETIKLAMTILNGGSVLMIRFSDSAVVDPPLSLIDHNGRRAAMRYCDGLTTYQGTNYLAAFEALERLRLPSGTPVIWVSDGMPTTGTPAEIAERARRLGLPLHTFAVQAEADAQALLAEMSKVSGGRAVSVSDGEALARTLIELAFGLTDYLAYEPEVDRQEFRGTYGGGSILLLGYNATTTVTGAPPNDATLTYTAALPGVHVSVTRIELSARSDLSFAIGARRTPQGRLAKVLRNDYRSYELTGIKPADGRPTAGTSIEVDLRPSPPMVDAQGAVVPRRLPDLEIEMRDRQGQIREMATAAPSGEDPIRLTLAVPAEPDLDLDLVKIESLRDGDVLFRREVPLRSLRTVRPR